MRNRYGSRAVTPTTNQPGFWETIGDQIPGLARGSLAGLLGLPGDVEEMAISGAPFALLSQGKISPQRFSNLATQNYSPGLLTSEEIARPLRKEGLLSKTPLEGEYTELAGNFLSPDFFIGDIAKLGALGLGASIFTSPAQKAVREVSKEALPSQQWLKQLEGRGVKKDELEWTGLLNFLKGKKGNIQKSEVEDFIEANKIDVQEVVYNKGVVTDEHDLAIRASVADEMDDLVQNDEGLYNMRDEVIPLIKDYRNNEMLTGDLARLDEYFEGYTMGGQHGSYTDDFYEEIKGQWNLGDTTKHSDPSLQLPGGENYKELLLTLPNTKLEKAGRELAEFEAQFKSKPIPDQYWGEEKRLRQAIADAKDEAGTFTGSHFPEDNILSWVRFNERVDPDGNKVLFIEEIQSDWGHTGLERGFETLERKKIWKDMKNVETKMNNISEERQVLNNSLTHQDIENYHEDLEIFAKHHGLDVDEVDESIPEVLALRRKFDPNYDKRLELNKKYDDLEKERDQLLRDHAGAPGGMTPRAPFVTDTHQWSNLALKRMIKWASDEGFDSIAWTTGKQQGERYHRLKPVRSIKFEKDGDKYMIQAFEGPDLVPQGDMPSINEYYGGRIELADKKTHFSEAEMRKVFGDEVADQIVNHTPVDYLDSLSPENRKIAERMIAEGKEDPEILTSGIFDKDWETLSKTQPDIEHNQIHDAIQGYKDESGSISNIENLDVGGEYGKFIYDKVLTEQGKKIGKKYGAKVEKGHADAEMARRGVTLEHKHDSANWRITTGDKIDKNIPAFGTLEEAKEYLLKTDPDDVPGTVWKMKLTDKLKEAAKEGLPYYALVPPGLLAVGAQRERQSLLE